MIDEKTQKLHGDFIAAKKAAEDARLEARSAERVAHKAATAHRRAEELLSLATVTLELALGMAPSEEAIAALRASDVEFTVPGVME